MRSFQVRVLAPVPDPHAYKTTTFCSLTQAKRKLARQRACGKIAASQRGPMTKPVDPNKISIVTVRLPEATIARMRALIDPNLPKVVDVHRAAVLAGLRVLERERREEEYEARGVVVVPRKYAQLLEYLGKVSFTTETTIQ